MKNNIYRYLITGLILCGSLTLISLAFWNQEIVYSLPTPLPANYIAVEIGGAINLGDPSIQKKGKPLFLHFYNPDCPCSRFNVPHVKSLIKKYSDKVDFAVVILNKEGAIDATEIGASFSPGIPVFTDASIAKKCGVYSTPQAVIIDDESKLFFRGNYNKSRYCTEKQTNYAEIAMDALLNKNSAPSLGEAATVAYGCQLPNCTK